MYSSSSYSRVAINHFTSAICVDAAQQSLTFSYGYSVFSGDGGETKNIWQARKKSFFLLVWTSENVDALLGLKPLLWLQLGMCELAMCVCVYVWGLGYSNKLTHFGTRFCYYTEGEGLHAFVHTISLIFQLGVWPFYSRLPCYPIIVPGYRLYLFHAYRRTTKRVRVM